MASAPSCRRAPASQSLPSATRSVRLQPAATVCRHHVVAHRRNHMSSSTQHAQFSPCYPQASAEVDLTALPEPTSGRHHLRICPSNRAFSVCARCGLRLPRRAWSAGLRAPLPHSLYYACRVKAAGDNLLHCRSEQAVRQQHANQTEGHQLLRLRERADQLRRPVGRPNSPQPRCAPRPPQATLEQTFSIGLPGT